MSRALRVRCRIDDPQIPFRFRVFENISYAVWNQCRVVLVCMLSCGMIYPIAFVVSTSHFPSINVCFYPTQFYALQLAIRASPPPGTGCNYHLAIPAHAQGIAARLDTDTLVYVCLIITFRELCTESRPSGA